MRLKAIILENFRCYKEKTLIPVGNLTAFIGKNDIGKSAILEALEIFFNEEIIKCEHSDVCVYNSDKKIRIACIFTDFSDEVVIDVKAKTSLRNEYLLNSDGDLEIHKTFDCNVQRIKANIFVCAEHPTIKNGNDLLSLKNSELKQRLKDLNAENNKVDLRFNPSIRSAIWKNCSDLNLKTQYIAVDKEDAKAIWESLQKELPAFALFQADRKSIDGDAEIQDPMKVAIANAVKVIQSDLEKIKQFVREKATEVANRTLDKLREMDAGLAGQLKPHFKDEPKWETLFKLSLTGDDQIPINKRGSGIRRLILLSFFRAEAERKQKEKSSNSVIYAIEEPETSQHPRNQRMIIEALTELSNQDNCQVIITTHVPGIASLLPTDSLRYIDRRADKQPRINYGEEIFAQIADDLGILADKRIKVLVCVEGPNDVKFLKSISKILNEADPTIPDISNNPELAIIHLGGTTLIDWVKNHYLKEFHLPEIHIYDRGTEQPPRFEEACRIVNARRDNSWATLTNKLEIENYLHPQAIRIIYPHFEAEFGDNDDVPLLVARHVHENSGSEYTWDQLEEKDWNSKMGRVKARLCGEAVEVMTYEQLNQRDPGGEIISWFREIARHL